MAVQSGSTQTPNWGLFQAYPMGVTISYPLRRTSYFTALVLLLGRKKTPRGIDHTIQQNGIWYYSSPTIDGIVGGNIPLDPNELPGQAGDHLGNTSISYQPIMSDLMYVNGNYENNRFDIGQVDLLILKDLGWTIQNYQNLPLVDPLDKYNIVGTAGNDVINVSKFSSTISAGAGNDTIILPGGTGNGNYFIDGGPGIDKLVVPQASSIFNIVRYGSDFLLQSKDGSQGVSLLRSVENIQFSDKTVALDNSVDLTTPALTTYQKMYGVAPSSAELNVLVQFNSAQYEYGVQIQVQDPIVYVYSALAQALSVQSDTGSTAFKSTWGPLAIPSDATFVTQAYADVFGTQGSAAQIQVFIGQINFYKSLYTASGAFGTDANQIDLLARGAIYGQMLGVKVESSGPIPVESSQNPDTTLIGISAPQDMAHILV